MSQAKQTQQDIYVTLTGKRNDEFEEWQDVRGVGGGRGDLEMMESMYI